MSSSVIGDSSAVFALSVTSDHDHQKAKVISQKFKKTGVSVIVPGEIFTEIVNILGRKISHKVAIEVGNIIFKDQLFTLVDTTKRIRERAFEMFQKQQESVSFTDCLVMAFADEFETKEIFGFDEAFKKNGYRRIGIDT